MSIVSLLDNYVDMNYFNNLLYKGGGDPILTKKKILTMRHFINILLKLFKHNYDSIKSKSNRITRSSRRSGGEGLGNYASATFYSDLDYSNSYAFPPMALTERPVI